MKGFLQEDKIWHMARHPNVVTYFGACHVARPCFFVSEEAENGNVPDFVYRQKRQGRSLVWRMMHGAAMGLRYLHENGIIHGDMKCNNIVVDSKAVAKLTDFGMSFELGSTRISSGGPVRWTAPECLIQKRAPSFESDKYSLGMCVVEAATGRVPWGTSCVDEQVIDQLAHRHFLPRPAELNDDQWRLVKSLCAFEAGRRCTLSDAIDQLEKFAVSEETAEAKHRPRATIRRL
ncbi:TKL protein kinase [Phytophthora megakarya]|uniref:TKL protein kinase n=1 Tax=Phytophthora megakarya TaxID=4795 RepID=A0A225W400_9STRA|nr:TKL protein kinase [Phytophthora megakarya]